MGLTETFCWLLVSMKHVYTFELKHSVVRYRKMWNFWRKTITSIKCFFLTKCANKTKTFNKKRYAWSFKTTEGVKMQLDSICYLLLKIVFSLSKFNFYLYSFISLPRLHWDTTLGCHSSGKVKNKDEEKLIFAFFIAYLLYLHLGAVRCDAVPSFYRHTVVK